MSIELPPRRQSTNSALLTPPSPADVNPIDDFTSAATAAASGAISPIGQQHHQTSSPAAAGGLAGCRPGLGRCSVVSRDTHK